MKYRVTLNNKTEDNRTVRTQLIDAENPEYAMRAAFSRRRFKRLPPETRSGDVCVNLYPFECVFFNFID